METWEELEEKCLHCDRCELCRTRHNVVFGVGNRSSRLLFVGEGPGEQEDLQGITWNVTDDQADFGLLYQNRLKVLRAAYSRFTPDKDYACFCTENSNWLPDFTLFMALKDKFGGKPWYEWEHKLKFRDPDAIWQARNQLKEEIAFFTFPKPFLFQKTSGNPLGKSEVFLSIL